MILLITFSHYDSKRVRLVHRGIIENSRHTISLNTVIWLLVSITLIIVLGFRDIRTGDYEAYINLFKTVNSSKTIIHPEKSNYLFDWLCRIVYLIGGSANLVFVFSAIITIVFFHSV